MSETRTVELLIVNKLGLHARAAAKFVTTASRFESEITVRRDGREVNGKSIMGVMMLAAARGTTVEVTASGPDAQEALEALHALVDDRFGEAE
jgi:phosphocarrier protein